MPMAQAKAFWKEKKYEEALPLYQQLYCPTCDKWFLWEYAQILKQLGKNKEALAVSKAVYQREPNFAYNNSLLSWLLYECYFKEKQVDYSQKEIEKRYHIALSVTTFTKQGDGSAYDKIITRMVKIFKNLSSVPHEKILRLLETLSVDLLSEEAGVYEKNGKEAEYQSPKEMYFAIKTKALLEQKEYEACIACCEEAQEKIKTFHHGNEGWILSRKALSYGALGNIDLAFQLQKQAILLKNHWSLFAGLAEIQLMQKDKKGALLSFCRAAFTNDPPKMKVGLYVDMAELFVEMGRGEVALQHLLFAKQVREEAGWSIPYGLTKKLYKLSPKEPVEKVSLSTLKQLWLKMIYHTMGEKEGVVSRLYAGGTAGMITLAQKSYFFRTTSMVAGGRLDLGTKVSFVLTEMYDKKLGQKGLACGYLKKIA